MTRNCTTPVKTIAVSGVCGHDVHNRKHKVPYNHYLTSMTSAGEITKKLFSHEGTNGKNMATLGPRHWLCQMVLVVAFVSRLVSCATLSGTDFLHNPDIGSSGAQKELGIMCQKNLGVSWECRSNLETSAASGMDGTTEEQVLLQFQKGVTRDPLNVLSSWTSSNLSSHCNWTGVVCNKFTGRVIALNLTGSQLQGTISSTLGDLQFLQLLDLSNNSFQGSIPTSIANCSHLTTLDLSRNMVNGNIPSQLSTLSNLQVLSLSQNALTGILPPPLSNLSALTVLSIDSNQLSGDITSVDWSQFGRLQILNLTHNRISGGIPESLSNCSNLVELYLGNNTLSGKIWSAFGNLRKLQWLDLATNALTGSIPSSLGNLADLRIFSVANNFLGGSIPHSLLNCSSMTSLLLFQNNLTGDIPADIGVLGHLEFIYLQSNSLIGSIPPSLANCTSLQNLLLYQNLLSGQIPSGLGNIQTLSYLGLHENLLQGSMPVSLLNCSSMIVLDLGQNQLDGEIPTDIGKLAYLEFFSLWGNNLTGGIPTSLVNCTFLLEIIINDNRLGGGMPTGIGVLQNLQTLFLYANNLVGSIPDSLMNCTSLTTIECGFNFFSGDIPQAIGKLPQLETLNLVSNSLRGGIPRSLGNVSSLQSILLENNYLTGEIPNELGLLSHLQGLNLSYNYLTGGIPPELFNISQLFELDLSVNFLNGTIQIELGTVGTLRLLHLNNNNLTGSISYAMTQNLANVLDMSLAYNSLSGDISGLDFSGLRNLMIGLDLSHNQFTGSLPQKIGALQFVQRMSFSFNAFSGEIPNAFSQCTALTSLDLSSNMLGGQIPQTLKALNLTSFNVSYNQLTGSIPSFLDGLNDSFFLGNPHLCGPLLSNKCSSASGCHGIRCHALWIIIPAIVAVGIVGALALISIWIIFRAKKKASRGTVQTVDFSKDVEDLSSENIVAATQGFSESRIVGVGPRSTVFAGVLPSGVMIAVKRFEFRDDVEKGKIFSSEIQRLSLLEHPNLLKIHGLFSYGDLKVLVTEYMPNGSLHKQLYDGDKCSLTWEQRLKIAIGVAEAIEYLHHDSFKPIIHQDLKPSNIFLDSNMEPKVADYGISKFVHHDSDDDSNVSSHFYGTIGYIPPEYGVLTDVSTIGDVYNFGLVLIELFTRKQPNDELFGGELSYRSWFVDAFPGQISEILDPTLRQELAQNEQDVGIHLLARLAMACTRPAQKDRPSMTEARDMLYSIKSTSLLYS